MRARVWSTESCTWAAIWARSSARARAWRSAIRSRTRLSHHGPNTTTRAPTTRRAPPTGPERGLVGMAEDEDQQPGHAQRHAGRDAQDEGRRVWRSASLWTMGRRSSLIHARSVVAGVAADQDGGGHGQEHRPDERAEIADVERRGHDLDHDQRRDMASTSRMPRRSATARDEDGGALPGQRQEEPGQGVGQEPMPLPRVRRTKPIRTSVTSMPVAADRPPHTPATTRSSGLRRSGPRRRWRWWPGGVRPPTMPVPPRPAPPPRAVASPSAVPSPVRRRRGRRRPAAPARLGAVGHGRIGGLGDHPMIAHPAGHGHQGDPERFGVRSGSDPGHAGFPSDRRPVHAAGMDTADPHSPHRPGRRSDHRTGPTRHRAAAPAPGRPDGGRGGRPAWPTASTSTPPWSGSAFVVLAVMGGLAVPLYLAGWLLIPEEGAELLGGRGAAGPGTDRR